MLKLAELRKENNLTQKKLAEALNMSVKKLATWEQRRAEPCIEDICALADYFGVTTDELLGRTDYGTGIVQVIGEQLTADEKNIVAAYRALDENAKKFFLEMTRNIAELKR